MPAGSNIRYASRIVYYEPESLNTTMRIFVAFAYLCCAVRSLDNGLGLTPAKEFYIYVNVGTAGFIA